jgi:GTP-binding protein EngB required for normal cell division
MKDFPGQDGNSTPSLPNDSRTIFTEAGDILSFADSIARRWGISVLLPQIYNLSEFINESDSVDVVLLGRFKAGKSSILNALLGRNIFPVDVLPATAVITRVSGGLTDHVSVLYRDGHLETVPLSEIKEYVTERGNPQNIRKVVRVEVRATGLRSFGGIRWVDSPGLGSLHASNTEATLDWLPRVGAALVAVAVDQPLGEEDRVLLRKLEEQTPFIVILLTKADLISGEKLESVVQYVDSQLTENFERELPVFPVSTRPGYEESVSRLKNSLQARLGGNRTSEENKIILYKLEAILKNCRGYLGLSLRAARSGTLSGTKLSQAIEEEWVFLSTLEDNFHLVVDQSSRRIRESLESCFVSKSQELTRKLQRELKEKLLGWRGNLAEESRWFQEWLDSQLVSELDRLGRENQDVWKVHVRKVEGGLNRDLQAFGDRISIKIKEALQYEYAGTSFEAKSTPLEKPSTHLDRVFDTPFEIIWFLIPMPVFRVLVHRHFINSLPWQVEKHLYRLSSEWTERIMDSIQGMMEKAGKHVRDELESLANLLKERMDASGSIEKDLGRLGELESLIRL